MSWEVDGRPLERVLVTRLRYLGDVVMSTVVTDLLRAGDPDLDIGFLCEAAHAPALASQAPSLRLHTLGAARRGTDARARAGAPGRESGGSTLAVLRALRQARYDAVVDLFFNPRSAWLLRFAGMPVRICGRRNRRSRLYTHVAERNAELVPERLAPGGLGEHVARLAPLRHVESGLPFVEWFTQRNEPVRPAIAPEPGETDRARTVLTEAGVDGPFVVFAPGATWPAKAWPAERWRQAVEAVVRPDRAIVVLTPPGDDGGVAAALAGAPCRVLPLLPLPTVLGVLDAAAAVLAVDGGVLHAAVALGRPTVGLFGPTDPAIWFPYGHLDACRVLATRPTCHPCDLHVCDDWICMPGLTADEAASALEDVLKEGVS